MSASDIGNQVSTAYHSALRSPWTEKWARFGFAIGGVVYLIIGVLAAMVAFEHRGRIVGPQGAIEEIGKQPFGHLLLFAVAVGLAGYAVWRLMLAISDLDRDGSNWKGMIVRAGVLCSAIGYASLSFFAFHRALGSATPKGDATRHWTARVLAHHWGAALVVLIGLALVGAGFAQTIYAFSGKFREKLRRSSASSSELDMLMQFGKWGYLAQAVVMCLVGVFLVVAGVNSDPRSARGLDGALRTLARQEYGPWLLGAVATGLAAYGIFMLMQARYRKLS
jgi:uncharacterized membrane protein HdeD (DUF308 family)